jgi:outer membrane immunogenic protein
MKKLLLASVAAVAFCAAPAFAADMPVKAPVYKAGPAPFSWSGCYLGGHVGYGWGNDRNSFADAILSGGTEGEGFPPEFASFNHNTSGGVYGGQLGCNYQAPNNWVWGVEGELFGSGIKGSHTNPEDATDPGTFSKFESRNRWNSDVALRLGYAVDRSLLYGKVGVAWGNFRYTESHDDFPTTHSCPGGGTCSVNINDTRAGLLLGAGWEYALQNNWTFKVEYNHINYGSHQIAYPNAVATMPTFPVRDTENIIKVGVNYLFGSNGKGPVVAKY